MLKNFMTGPARSYKTAEEAFAAIEKIYNDNVSHLRSSFDAFAKGTLKDKKVAAFYPYIRM